MGGSLQKNIITLFTIQYSTAYNLLCSLLYCTLRNNTNLIFRTVLILTQDTYNTTQYLLYLQSDTVVFSTYTVRYNTYSTYLIIEYSTLYSQYDTIVTLFSVRHDSYSTYNKTILITFSL